MPKALPENLPPEAKLPYLLLLLQNLPPRHIPTGSRHYNFIKFKPSEEDIDLTGTEQGALNRSLEVAFGNRVKGPIEFKERGPGLDAVVDVLERTITGDSGENILLWKWVDDLLSSCEAAYAKAEQELPDVNRRAKRAIQPNGGSESDDSEQPKRSKRKKSKVVQELELDDDGTSTYGSDGSSLAPLPDDSDSESSAADVINISSDDGGSDSEADGDGGSTAKTRASLGKKGGNALARLRDTGKQPVRKRAPAKKTKAMKQAEHIQRVAAGTAQRFTWPPDDLRDDPLPPPDPHAGGAPRDELAHELAVRCFTISTNEERWRCTQPGCHTSWKGHLQPKRVMKHAMYCKGISSELHALVLQRSAASSLSAKVAKLDAEAPVASDEEDAGKKGGPGSLLAMAKAGGREALQLRFDHRLVTLICDAGLPASILDRPTWKALVTTSNSSLTAISASKFSDNYLPSEAAHALSASYERLSKLQNLTISFDGSTNKLIQTTYTIHVTEPRTRDTHLMAGEEQSGIPHTAEYLVEILEKIMKKIGLSRFVLVLSDDTGAPRLARQILGDRYPWLLTANDPVHHMHNVIKDICALSHFQMIGSLRLVIRFFKQSSLAAQHLRSQRLLDGKTRGLQKNNRTRFALMTRMGNSALYNLDSIKTVVDKNIVLTTAKERRTYSFLRNEQRFGEFRLHLRQLLAVTIPISKSLKCLESPHCNPGDTYKFWLAIMATVRDLFDTNDDGLGLPPGVIRDITRILNRRFKQMFDGPQRILFKAALFVDPVWVTSSLWRKKDPNALAASARNSSGPSARIEPLPRSDSDLRKAIPSLVDIGSFLGKLLKSHIQAMPENGFASFGTALEVRDVFQAQFISYVRQDYPFNRAAAKGAISYWKSLERIPDAKLMATVALRLLSMVGNSMAEERTASIFTWLNSNNRGSMNASTMVQYAQVKQHNMRQNPVTTTKPSVLRFRDLAAHIRTDVLGVPQDDGGIEAPVPAATPSSDMRTDKAGTTTDDAGGEEGDPLEELFDELDSCDIDSDLANDFDTEDDSFEPTSADGVDLLSPMLRDLLSDIPVDGARWPAAAASSQKDQSTTAERMDLDDVDFSFL